MICTRGRRQQGAGGPCPPWIFKHDINIVDRGLNVLFFGLFAIFRTFFRCPLPLWKRLNSAIFRYFLLIFGLFFCWLPPLENFLPTPLYVPHFIGFELNRWLGLLQMSDFLISFFIAERN